VAGQATWVPRQGGLGHHKNRPYVAWPQEKVPGDKVTLSCTCMGPRTRWPMAYDKMISGCLRAMTLWARLPDLVTWAHDKMEWT